MKELLYKGIFNSAPVPLIVTDTKGKIKLINEKATTLLDETATPFIGLNFCDFIDRTFLKDYLKTKDSLSFEDFLEIYKHEQTHWVKGKKGANIYADIKAEFYESANKGLYIWTLDPIEISKKLSYDLKERVKEQLAILNVVEIFFQNPSIQTALQLCLPAIQAGWQFPEATGVRILLSSGAEFSTDNFKKTEWLLQSRIRSTKGEYGYLEVCYQEEVPAYRGATFLYEEERLITVLAKILGIYIELWNHIEKVSIDASLLKKITSRVPANTYQFEILPEGIAKMLFFNKGNELYNDDPSFKYLESEPNKTVEVVHEMDRDKVRNAFLKAYESKGYLSVQYRIFINNTIRWRWLNALPEKTTDGKTIWYGASQDITPIVEYLASVEQILFDFSHVIRKPISNIIGISTLIEDSQISEMDLRLSVKYLRKTAEELNLAVQRLDLLYNKKRSLNQNLNIDFSAIIDKRTNFWGNEI